MECRLIKTDKILFQQSRFGHPDIFARCDPLQMLKEERAQETLRPVALDRFAHFLPGDEPDLFIGTATVEKDKIRSVPRRIRAAIDRLERPRVPQTFERA